MDLPPSALFALTVSPSTPSPHLCRQICNIYAAKDLGLWGGTGVPKSFTVPLREGSSSSQALVANAAPSDPTAMRLCPHACPIPGNASYSYQSTQSSSNLLTELKLTTGPPVP